jgi:hypothetical protein
MGTVAAHVVADILNDATVLSVRIAADLVKPAASIKALIVVLRPNLRLA